jgi:hypothetical protein
MTENTFSFELISEAIKWNGRLAAAYETVCRNVRLYEDEVQQYRDTVAKQEAELVRLRAHNYELQHAKDSVDPDKMIKPSEIDLILAIRAGKIITHKLPASFEEAISEAAFMIDEARARCGMMPQVVGHAVKGLAPYPQQFGRGNRKPPGDADADKAVAWGSLKVERNAALVAESERLNPFHTAAVARKVEADLNQANEPYRDSEPGEHQEVLDALYNTQAEDEDIS